MAGGKGRECELCHEKPARLFCLADDASLCWTCDASVHAANFLVARHHRSLLCHSCCSPTGSTRNGRQIYPNPSPPLFCSNCTSSLQTKHCSIQNEISSSSSSSSTLSFAAASCSCNGSTVDSCNGGRKLILSVKIGLPDGEETEEITSVKENLGISDTQAITSTSEYHDNKKLGSEASCVRCNLNMTAMPFKDKWPRQKYCKSSLSASCQKHCEDRGSDDEEEKEVTSINEKLGISDTPITSSTTPTPPDELSRKGTSVASKWQPYPSSAHDPRTDGKPVKGRLSAVTSKRARC